ncbi:MAG: type II restriction endonuclease [Hyphomicrobiales bacterium]|nr:type II restriction endonuclease [Hyphomicrobiales bacterium]
MALADVGDWMNEFGRPGVVWYAKRLSANDTLATNAHQAGPYIPKAFLFSVLPSLNRPEVLNPDVDLKVCVDSHKDRRVARVVWYNNQVLGTGTRNETRVTRFGGAGSALLDPDSTGALAVFAFVIEGGSASECHIWVCGAEGTEADLFEERIGPVEPKQHVVWMPGGAPPLSGLLATAPAAPASCHLTVAEIPPAWLVQFPTGEEIIRLAISRTPPAPTGADMRLVRRRDCEFEIFQSVEEAVYLPKITAGFSGISTFLSLAQTILQSRKSRSGNSLELHAREILKEEGFIADTTFTHRPVIEGGKRPDFLFPSQAAYEDRSWPDAALRMLAAKTTCRDRWRQIINEADRIREKHLLTLQEGVSEGQFREMTEAGVKLVVPAKLHGSYPSSVRPHLITLASFLEDLRRLPARRR